MAKTQSNTTRAVLAMQITVKDLNDVLNKLDTISTSVATLRDVVERLKRKLATQDKALPSRMRRDHGVRP